MRVRHLGLVSALAIFIAVTDAARLPQLHALAIATVLAAGPPAKLPEPAAEGVAAFERGDFDGAFAILKPFVFDIDKDNRYRSSPEPLAALYLARLYARGWGTAQDPVLASVLYHLATAGLVGQLGRDHPDVVSVIREYEAAYSGVLLDQDEVDGVLGCPFFDGIGRTEVALHTGGTLVLDRGGFHVAASGESVTKSLRSYCAGGRGVVVLVRGSQLRAVTGSPTHTRDFVEMFWWASAASGGHIRRQLVWAIFEVVGTTVEVRISQPLLTVFDTPFPSSEEVPDIVRAAFLQVNEQGRVEFTVRGVGSKLLK